MNSLVKILHDSQNIMRQICNKNALKKLSPLKIFIFFLIGFLGCAVLQAVSEYPARLVFLMTSHLNYTISLT